MGVPRKTTKDVISSSHGPMTLETHHIPTGRYTVVVTCPNCKQTEDLGLHLWPVLICKPGIRVISLDVSVASSTHQCKGV